MKTWIILLVFLISFPVFGNPLDADVSREVETLIAFIENSPCRFKRNGTWHDAGQAVNHIRRKYNYLLKKNLVNSTEEFIERAASQSSISGKAYKIQCNNGETITCGQWLKAELDRIRAKTQGQ